jgi:hypothetical protein
VGDYWKRVIRSKEEAFHKDCLKRTVKFPKSVMIWGCMSARGLGKYQFIEGTVNAEKYQEILQNSLLPTLQFCILKMILFSNKMGQHVTPRKQLKNGSVNIT